MTADDRFHWTGPQRDASEVDSEFDCPRCEVTRPSTAVQYDALGYPVCPVCGFESR
jgi:hypothetical protein